MSQVIGFRLDRHNPREAQALAVLARWQEQGYSTRHILTEALIQLGTEEHSEGLPVAEINDLVSQLAALLERMQSGEVVSRERAGSQSRDEKLSEAFLASVSQASKSGVRLE